MARVVISIVGASVELDDDASTAAKLTTIALKTLKDASVIPIPKPEDPKSIAGGAGFHTELLGLPEVDAYSTIVKR